MCAEASPQPDPAETSVPRRGAGRAEGSPEPRVVDWSAGPSYRPILEGPPGTFGMRSGRVDLGPGEGVGAHSTGDHEETLVVVEGAGEVALEGRSPMPIRAGQSVYIPPRTVHQVRCTGPGRLRYVFVVAPAG